MKQWHVWIFTSICTIFFACFSTAVMCYLSLIVPVSPWIDPTLALTSLGVVLIFGRWWSEEILSDSLLIATAAGSVGGIIGTAIAWSIPTLYFIDKELFLSWLARPLPCIAFLFFLIISIGGIGMLVARLFMNLEYQSSYRFPIAQVINRTLAVRTSSYQALVLFIGCISSLLFHILQCSIARIPRILMVLHETLFLWFRIPKVMIHFDFVPMLWAIGSITGEVIAIPFLIAWSLKIGVLEPVYRMFFASNTFSEVDFFLAFCTGLVLEGVVMSFVKLIFKKYNGHSSKTFVQRATSYISQTHYYLSVTDTKELFLILCLSFLFLYGLARFSFLGALYIIISVILCSYQLILFMGKIGLAPLGRFAVFVMMPGLILFKYSSWQATLVAACVEIAGGVAASASSGIRALQLAHIRNKRLIHIMQWIALSVSALTAAFIFWFLAHYIGIGSAGLVAGRSQARALMLRVDTMHWGVVMSGSVVAWVLQRYGINATLILGGLVMPFDWSLILIISGMSIKWFKQWGDSSPLWSGILATSSLWMILRALLAFRC